MPPLPLQSPARRGAMGASCLSRLCCWISASASAAGSPPPSLLPRAAGPCPLSLLSPSPRAACASSPRKMRLLPQIQAVGLISPRLFPIDRSFHRRLDRRREKDTGRMARSENNEAHGSSNIPAAPAGAAAAAGGGGASAAGSGKQEAAPARGAEGQSVVRRLQSELMALMMGGDSGVSVFPEGDNIFHWVGTIAGSAATASRSPSPATTPTSRPRSGSTPPASTPTSTPTATSASISSRTSGPPPTTSAPSSSPSRAS